MRANTSECIMFLNRQIEKAAKLTRANCMRLSISNDGTLTLHGATSYPPFGVVSAEGHGKSITEAAHDLNAQLGEKIATLLVETMPSDEDCDEAVKISNQIMHEVQP